MSTHEQETEAGAEKAKKPYAVPELKEYGKMTTLTQGNLVLSVVTPLTVTLLDAG